MIRPIDIRLNAAHPELPLAEAVTYTGSPSTVLIRGVPPNCGRWAITAVFVAASFPDGSTTTRAAVQSANGVWVATLPATATSGRTANGIRIMADGVDENGEAVTGYILGVADFAVASLDVTPAPEPGGTAYSLRYFDTLPDPAKKGDVIRVNGDLKFYNGTAWQPFTDLSDYYTADQVDDAIDKLAAYYITYNAAGENFPTRAALLNAQTYYSGGEVRTPTRNDYAVVLADEAHGGAEWRYIYAVADGETVGQWEAQYPIETNDYAALSNKPQINGNTLTGNKTAAQLGLQDTLTPQQLTNISNVPNKADVSALPYALGAAITSSAQLADRTANYIAPTSGTASIALTFPPSDNVKARDFYALVAPGASFGGSISFTAPTGATIYGDSFGATVMPGEAWLFSITEIANNQFYTRAIKMEVPA